MKYFDLALCKVPDTLANQHVLSPSFTPGQTGSKKQHLNWLCNMLSTASKRLDDAQRRYKRNCDNRLERSLQEYAIGDDTLVERETAPREEKNSRADKMPHKLTPRMEEPFRVVAVHSNNITFMRDGLKDRVSNYLVVKVSSKKKTN